MAPEAAVSFPDHRRGNGRGTEMPWTKYFGNSSYNNAVSGSPTPVTIGQFLKKAPRTVGTVLSLFLLCNVFLLQAVFDEGSVAVTSHGNGPGSSRGGVEFFTTLRKYFFKKDKEWRVAATRLPARLLTNNVYSEGAAKFRETDELLGCDSLSSLANIQFVATGWTKSAYRAVLKNGQSVAVKTVNAQGHDVAECLKQFKTEETDRALPECYMLASAKILREIYLLSKLDHQNVIKMVGYCVPHKKFSEKQNTVAIITELGEPFDVIRLLQMSWEDRLRLTLDLARLVQYFSSYVEGPLRISDFRRQQFVFVDGHLRLSDVDDVTLGDISCQSDKDCVLDLLVSNRSANSDAKVVSVPCDSGICRGLSEKSNTVQAGRHFVNFILAHGVPAGLEADAQEIARAFTTASWNSSYILKRTEDVVRLYSLGLYRLKDSNATTLNLSETSNYKRLVNRDLPGVFDYRCRQSLSGQQGCSHSVSDAEEAATICSSSPQCKAFVFTNDTTWTGRRIAHFKSNFSNSTIKDGSVLYLKND